MIRPFTSPEKINEFVKFMDSLIGKEHSPQPNSTLKALLNWHNDLYPMNKKHSIVCAACVATAWKRCSAYHQQIGKDALAQIAKLLPELEKKREDLVREIEEETKVESKKTKPKK